MTGIVTNTRVTHATPAALYAHTPSRYWEDDGKIPPASRKSCKDIARQLIEDDPGRNINFLRRRKRSTDEFIEKGEKLGATLKE
ncbi:hypothetical protein RUM44_003633 [Polyplax serrata]|uniref:alkaline phosphatase n=1 Tax=Polyplax serrata TaxID=468196 RepID=A0ABR1AH07_POLSC